MPPLRRPERRTTEKAFLEEVKNWAPEICPDQFTFETPVGTINVERDDIMQYPLTPEECFPPELSENLTVDEVIEKYGEHLSEEQITNLKNLKNKNDI